MTVIAIVIGTLGKRLGNNNNNKNNNNNNNNKNGGNSKSEEKSRLSKPEHR